MIDLHSHILHGIDDGSKDLDESLKMAQEAYESGFSSVFCTSHFMEESYVNRDENQVRLNDLREKLIYDSIDTNLYSGNEIYISTEVINWIDQNRFQTLNYSKYFLMELPMDSKVPYLNPIIFKCILKGLVPIIAHPERYKFVQDDPNSLIPFIESGVLFQMNYGSIIGVYGKEVLKTAVILLKNDMIHFFGTDAHRKNSIYMKMDNILRTLRRLIDEDTINILSSVNPQIVFENGDVKVNKPYFYKKAFSFK
ncbi:MAG: hypothetical protein FWC47_01490 [Oscillospiraceae bacterium]|nr:hypothetical protein [Oscillospiraceae bacterium]